MPHKRAKKSSREQQKKQIGTDLVPVRNTASDEAIPKSLSRVLNAAKVQQEWREKNRKRKLEEVGASRSEEGRGKKRKTEGGASGMKILPGETLGHFNKRVEDSLRGDIRLAVKASSAHVRKVVKEDGANTSVTRKPSQPAPSTKESKEGHAFSPETEEKISKQGPTDFAAFSTSAPRRLNDVVQAPPELKHLPRGVKPKAKLGSADVIKKRSLREGVLSMAQKAMLDEEREKAIQMYRDMKKRQLNS